MTNEKAPRRKTRGFFGFGVRRLVAALGWGGAFGPFGVGFGHCSIPRWPGKGTGLESLPHLQWSNARVQRRAVRGNPFLAARTPIVHSDGAVAERRRRDQLEPSRAGQPALV